jgi:hypothetical protein
MEVRRITWRSALRVGLATGWLLSLFPAMAVAFGVVQVLATLSAVVASIEPFNIQIMGASLGAIDPIQFLGQQQNAAQLATLAASGGLIFLAVTLALTLFGGALVVAGVVLFVAAYNALAKWVGGLEVELAPSRAPRPGTSIVED